MKTPEILRAAADTFDERQAVYQDNHERLGKVMAALFPQGVRAVTELDHERYALLMLIMVKWTRYAVQWGDGHQDSVRDAIVYSAMLEALDADRYQPRQRDDQQDAGGAPVMD
jgi:hypothetical protein